MPIISGPGAERAGRDALIDFHASGEGGEAAWDRVRPALAAPAAWREAIEELKREAARHGTDLRPGARVPLELYVAANQRERQGVVGRLIEELSRLVERLTPTAPGHSRHRGLAGELGPSGRDLVDTDRLTGLLPETRGARALPPERLELLAEARATLEAGLRASRGPALLVLHSGVWPAGIELSGVEVVEVAAPLDAAVTTFDERVRPSVELLRAVRRARLEVEGAFRPGRHDRALARFDWRALAPGELALLPRIVVLEDAARVRSQGIGALSNLLQSARPIHVLLIDDALARVVESGGPEIAYLAAAQHVAFVVQTTLARPGHLVSGIEGLARSPGAALAVVAVPSASGEPAPELQLLAAHRARGTPCFRFDPLAGDTWAACLTLDAESQPDRRWPSCEASYVGSGGEPCTREEAFTPAHAAALAQGGSRHFRTVRGEAEGEQQVEIAEYLALPDGERRGKLPFIWLTDGEGRAVRGVTTRALVAACRERLALRRVLSELGGPGDERTGPVAEPLSAEPPTPGLAATPQGAERGEEALVREREATIVGLLNALLDLDGAEPPDLSPAELAAAAADSVTETPAAPAGSSAPPLGPYIDTPLCTSCNECTNLNPRMFRYDENKQAYIADATAGSFAELVKAAEKCTARCIHPGTPRNGDRTANDKLLARAAKFN